MKNGQSLVYLVAIGLALFFTISAGVYKFVIEEPPREPRIIPELGKAGSTHAHVSMLMFVGGDVVSFCEPRFMLKSQFVHFEGDNCKVIHTYATGVTLPIFFKTLGVELTETCLTLPLNNGRHCNDGTKRVSVVINGTEVPILDLAYYALRNNDHVLVNYGKEEGGLLRFKYNQVPPIPADINVSLPAAVE